MLPCVEASSCWCYVNGYTALWSSISILSPGCRKSSAPDMSCCWCGAFVSGTSERFTTYELFEPLCFIIVRPLASEMPEVCGYDRTTKMLSMAWALCDTLPMFELINCVEFVAVAELVPVTMFYSYGSMNPRCFEGNRFFYW